MDQNLKEKQRIDVINAVHQKLKCQESSKIEDKTTLLF